MKKFFTFLLLISLTISVNAQNADRKWGFGIFGGKTEYNGDLGNGFLEYGSDFSGFGGISLSRYISKSFDVKLQGTFGNYAYTKTKLLKFIGRKADGNLLFAYKLNNGYIFKENAILAPYLAVGGGMANMWNYPESGGSINGGYDYLYTAGLGLNCNLTDWVALQYQFLYNFTNNDNRDKLISQKNDNFMAHSLGLVFSFGSPRDTDKDGIPDKLDKCPNTPIGVKIDINGCPLDVDGDAIPDYLDKCPDVKGIEAFQGCPDTDGDGITDAEDKCPTVKGLAAFQGCPDSDGDGITDAEDKCPNVKGLAAFNGCPDTDGDGITDAEDRCPNVKGSKELKGCPDKDNDGVADIDDKCPDVSGLKENKGCPEVKAAVKETFRKALQGIQFATGKDIILKPSFPILDQIANIMKENPTYKLQINGHTDNVGDAVKNKTLSEKRANSVKTYLLKQGVEETRMITAGYGDVMPVADNKTKDGQKQNRRVEFIVEF
jgi:outer membrane protein OmpA-like peptidoglycan-associated protein